MLSLVPFKLCLHCILFWPIRNLGIVPFLPTVNAIYISKVIAVFQFFTHYTDRTLFAVDTIQDLQNLNNLSYIPRSAQVK